MPRGVTFTAREKEVLHDIMTRAWERKRGRKPEAKRVYLNPKKQRK